MAIITAQAKKALELKNTYKLEHIINTEIVAVVTLKPQVDGKIVVSVFLMTQNPRQRIQDVNGMQGTAIGMATVEATVRNLCVSIHKKYKDMMSPSTVARQRGSSVEFVARVEAIDDVRNPRNFDPYVKKGWGEKTADAAVTYYSNTFGKFYEQYGEDADTEDFEEFRAGEVDRIYKKQYIRTDVNVEVIQRRRDGIYNSLNTRFSYAAAVQKFLLENHPEGNFPVTPIPVSIRTTARSAERVKAISMEQYIKLVAILQQLCLANVPYGFAVLLEVVCGARIGESCAPLIGDFELKPDHGRYYICHQVDQKEERTDVLKNDVLSICIFWKLFDGYDQAASLSA